MAPPPAKAQAARKRTRKRKRRAASSSSESSSDDDSSSDSESPNHAVVRVPVKATKKQSQPEPVAEALTSSSESDSDSDSSDREPAARKLSPEPASKTADPRPPRRAPSPTPPPSEIPLFLPQKGVSEQEKQNEQVLKERFRKFWMSSVADAFKDDLEEIRKEPNLTSSRLAMLIDSLAAGGDVLTSAQIGSDDSVTEMEIVLEHNI